MAEWISAIAAVVALAVAGFAAHLQLGLRVTIAELRQELDEIYMRKPKNGEDAFVTRREMELRLRSGVRQ